MFRDIGTSLSERLLLYRWSTGVELVAAGMLILCVLRWIWVRVRQSEFYTLLRHSECRRGTHQDSSNGEVDTPPPRFFLYIEISI